MGNIATENAAGRRITNLLDAGSFVEIGGAVTARATDFNMREKETPADGVITGYGVIDGNLVYVYSQDASVLNGAMGEMHAKKIVNIYDMAMKMGAPVIGLIDCAGLRLQEAADALNAFEAVYGFRRSAADFRNFWDMRRRAFPCSGTYRFYVYGKFKGKIICKFSECDRRQQYLQM